MNKNTPPSKTHSAPSLRGDTWLVLADE